MKKTTSKAKETEYYIDNNEFTNELVEYQAKCKLAKENDKPKPKVPDSIGAKIILIANKLSSRYNFASYTYREEMVGDGIIAALEVIDKFDVNKSSNPLSFFTQQIWWAFVRRIKTEQNLHNMVEEDMLNCVPYTTQEHDRDIVISSVIDDTYLWYNA